jgi:hypothetical protein
VLLLEALVAGGDDGVELSLMSSPVLGVTTRGPTGIDERMLLKNLYPVRFIPCRDTGGNTAMRCNLYAGVRVRR